MFLTLLLVTLLIAAVSAFAVVQLFDRPIATILGRIVTKELAGAWQRYVKFAIYVVGISGGVRIWELEKYITARAKDGVPVALTGDRWILEVYRTIMETLESIAWILLVFFAVALIAYVVVRGFELRRGSPKRSKG